MYADFGMTPERESIEINLPGWMKAHWQSMKLENQIYWARKINGDTSAAEVAESFCTHIRGEAIPY